MARLALSKIFKRHTKSPCLQLSQEGTNSNTWYEFKFPGIFALPSKRPDQSYYDFCESSRNERDNFHKQQSKYPPSTSVCIVSWPQMATLQLFKYFKETVKIHNFDFCIGQVSSSWIEFLANVSCKYPCWRVTVWICHWNLFPFPNNIKSRPWIQYDDSLTFIKNCKKPHLYSRKIS